MSNMLSLDFLIGTLSLGSIYALLSLGLVLVFGILKLVNFAYGEFVVAGGYLLWAIGNYTPVPWLVVAVLACIGVAALAVVTEFIAFRPVRTRSADALLVTSFAVSVILQNAAVIGISPRPKSVTFPDFFSQSVDVFGTVVPMRNLITIAATFVILALLVLLMKYTVLGIAMRAAAEDFSTARLMGIPANLVISAAFVLSGLVAGAASIFWIGKYGGVVDPYTGGAPLLIAFCAVVIGGMYSLQGAVLGGFAYGLLFNTLVYTLPESFQTYKIAILFALVVIFLVLRPQGLLQGTYAEERVG